MTEHGRHRRWTRTALVLVVAGAGLAGCREVEQASAPGYEPAKLEPVKGSDLQRVTFTAEGARRVGLRTAPVTRDGRDMVVPYDALIYDGAGTAYVYTSPKPLSYLRSEVTVDRVEGDRALLRRGPRPGTHVVTVGATEVYGAENDIAGGH